MGTCWTEAGQRVRSRSPAVAQGAAGCGRGGASWASTGMKTMLHRHWHLPVCTARFTFVQHPTVCTAPSPHPEPPQVDGRASGISQDRARLSLLQPWYKGTGPRDAGEPDGTGEERMFAVGPPPLKTRREPRSPKCLCWAGALQRLSLWVFPVVP